MHEHPWGATSWKIKAIQDPKNSPCLHFFVGGQCVHGGETKRWKVLVSKKTPAGKRTTWITSMKSSEPVSTRQCSNEDSRSKDRYESYDHILFLGNCARPMERDRPCLVSAMLWSIRQHLMKDRNQAVDVFSVEVGVGTHAGEKRNDEFSRGYQDDRCRGNAQNTEPSNIVKLY